MFSRNRVIRNFEEEANIKFFFTKFCIIFGFCCKIHFCENFYEISHFFTKVFVRAGNPCTSLYRIKINKKIQEIKKFSLELNKLENKSQRQFLINDEQAKKRTHFNFLVKTVKF